MGITVPTESKPNKGTRIAIVLAGVVAGAVVGVLIREMTGHDKAAIGAAIGLPALIALFGIFWIAEHWKDALTAAFAVTYFIFVAAALSGLIFPPTVTELPAGAAAALNGFTQLMIIVMTAYFGQEAVRAAAQAYSNAYVYGNKGTTPATPPASPPPSSGGPGGELAPDPERPVDRPFAPPVKGTVATRPLSTRTQARCSLECRRKHDAKYWASSASVGLGSDHRGGLRTAA